MDKQHADEIQCLQETHAKEVQCLHKKIKDLEQSIISSKTAKNGYKEEDNICNDFNDNQTIRGLVQAFVGFELGTFNKYDGKNKGHGKTDICCTNNCSFQIKKTKLGQFGQIDRHWLKDIIAFIPDLKPIAFMLEALCEIPLLECNQQIDKSKERVLLSPQNYSCNELTQFVQLLNERQIKRCMLNYVFKGTDPECAPTFLCGVQYDKTGETREKLTIYRMDDVVNHLMTHDFVINAGQSVVSLANILSFQRKGGDGGKKGANQVQFKLVFSKLDNQINNHQLVYSLV